MSPPVLGRLFAWIKGQPQSAPKAPARTAAQRKGGKVSFDERLVGGVDDERTVRDGSDDVTIASPRSPDVDGAQPKPGEFRYNPNLMAALPIAPDDAADAVRRVAGEIATRLKVAELPLEFESGALARLMVKVTGNTRALEVDFQNLPPTTLEVLRGQARVFEAALQAAGLRLKVLEGAAQVTDRLGS